MRSLCLLFLASLVNMDIFFKHFPPSVTWNWQFSSSLSAAGTGSCRRGMTLTQRHWTIIIKMSCSVKFCFRLLQSQPFHYLFSSLILLRTVCVLLSLSNKHRVSKKSNFVEGTRSGLETKVLWTNLLEHIEPLTQFS